MSGELNRKSVLKFLIDKDLNQAKLAKKAGCPRSLVTLTLKGERPGRKVRRALNDLGYSPESAKCEAK